MFWDDEPHQQTEATHRHLVGPEGNDHRHRLVDEGVERHEPLRRLGFSGIPGELAPSIQPNPDRISGDVRRSFRPLDQEFYDDSLDYGGATSLAVAATGSVHRRQLLGV